MRTALYSPRRHRGIPGWVSLVAAFITLIGVLGSCAGEDSPSPACDPGSGDVELVNSVGEIDQEYWLIPPADAFGAKPLWLLLPGGLGDHQSAYVGFGPYMREADAFVAIPNLQGDARHVDVVVALIGDVASVYCVDVNRVYAIGSSSSSRFAGELMEQASDRIAAFAVGLGGFGSTSDVTPTMPFWAWTGTTDRLPTEAAAELWAQRNGCGPAPQIEQLGSGVQHWHYEGCAAAAEYYYLEGMGHKVPAAECLPDDFNCAEYPDFDFVLEVSAFFDANPLSDS